MAGTLVKSVRLKITADDGDTEARLQSISAKADELARKHPDIKVKIDSAAATAKLAVLRKELKDTGSAEKGAGAEAVGLKARLDALAASAGAGTGLATGMQDAAASGSKLKLALAGLNLATGLAEPLVAGVTVAAGGLASGLTSAGIGLGAFGLVAKGVYSQVSTAAAQYQTAMNTTGAAQKKALVTYRQELGALTGPQKALVGSINQAQSAWQSFVAKNTSGVASVMRQGFGLLPKIFASLQPFLAPVEAALHGIIGDISHGLSSPAFKSFMDSMARNTGPMITGIAHAIGNVVKGLGGILRAFMPVSHTIMGGLDAITAKFAHWGQTLTQHSGFQSLMAMFRSETPLAVGVLKNLAGIIKTVVSQMTGMSTFSNSKMLLQLALPVVKLVNALLKAHPELVWLVLYLTMAWQGGVKLKAAFDGVQGALGGLKDARTALSNVKAGFSDAEVAASDASGVWGTVGGNISSAVTAVKGWTIWSKIAAAATKVWTGIQVAFDAVMDANPIALVVIAIVALVAAFVLLWTHCKAFRDFWKDVWHDIVAWAVDAWHWLEGAFKGIVKSLASAWDDVKHATGDAWHFITGLIQREVSIVEGVLAWFGRLPGLFRGWWDDAVSAVEGAAGRMLSFVESLPGRILRGLGDLGHLLWNAGVAVVEGFIRGIESMFSAVASAAESLVSNLGGKVLHALGISSPSKVARYWGQMTGEGMALGIEDKLARVGAAAGKMAAAAAPRAAAAGGAGAGGVRVEIDLHGDDELIRWLRGRIRVIGGGGPDSVQRALGRPG